LILDERHLALVLRQYTAHYTATGHTSPVGSGPWGIETQPDRHVAGLRSIRRRAVAAGLINEYHHTA